MDLTRVALMAVMMVYLQVGWTDIPMAVAMERWMVESLVPLTVGSMGVWWDNCSVGKSARWWISETDKYLAVLTAE